MSCNCVMRYNKFLLFLIFVFIHRNLEGIIESNPLSLPPRKASGSSRRDSNSSTSSAIERRGRFLADEDSNSSPVLLIRSRTNSRHVKSTIENLEQVNDDIFELWLLARHRWLVQKKVNTIRHIRLAVKVSVFFFFFFFFWISYYRFINNSNV